MVDTLVRAKAVLAAFRLAKRRSGLPKTSLRSLFRCTLTPVSRSALSLLPVQPSLPPTGGELALPDETVGELAYVCDAVNAVGAQRAGPQRAHVEASYCRTHSRQPASSCSAGATHADRCELTTHEGLRIKPTY